MKRDSQVAAAWGWLGALALETAAFALACRLAGQADFQTAAAGSLVAAVLGDSRQALGAAFFEEADVFYHRGVGHYRPRGLANDVFVKLQREIAPEAHVHATNVAEIVPWLYLATRMDSQQVTAYAVAAFLMGSDAGGRPDVAERILAEARRTNPRDYQVYLESGRLAIKINDLPRAGVYFATALRLWPGALDREDPRVLEDLATIQVCRGLLFEEAGDLARAQELYRQVLRDFPDRTPLRKRLEFIEAQGHSPSPPFEFWRPLLFRHAHVCAQEPEEHEKK